MMTECEVELTRMSTVVRLFELTFWRFPDEIIFLPVVYMERTRTDIVCPRGYCTSWTRIRRQ